MNVQDLSIDEFAQKLIETLEQASEDSRRVFHGRGKMYPAFEHVVVDYYAPVLWCTFFAEPSEELLECLRSTVAPQLESLGLQALGVSRRYLDGAPSEYLWCTQSFDQEAPQYARRGPLRFKVQLGGRQNTGFFLDMEPGRRWLENRVEGRKVLNLFSYTCAFSVVAAAAGASEVVNVDMARGALKQGQMNHQLNQELGLSRNCKTRFLGENILKSWGRIRRPGPYEVLIIDPPSFQKGSFVARSDYQKVLRRIPQLAVQGADILLCLNAPQLGEDFIDSIMSEACPECEKVERLAPSEDFPDINPDQQLKLFHFRYTGQWQGE